MAVRAAPKFKPRSRQSSARKNVAPWCTGTNRRRINKKKCTPCGNGILAGGTHVGKQRLIPLPRQKKTASFRAPLSTSKALPGCLSGVYGARGGKPRRLVCGLNEIDGKKKKKETLVKTEKSGTFRLAAPSRSHAAASQKSRLSRGGLLITRSGDWRGRGRGAVRRPPLKATRVNMQSQEAVITNTRRPGWTPHTLRRGDGPWDWTRAMSLRRQEADNLAGFASSVPLREIREKRPLFSTAWRV